MGSIEDSNIKGLRAIGLIVGRMAQEIQSAQALAGSVLEGAALLAE
jgi:hypothetical protein